MSERPQIQCWPLAGVVWLRGQDVTDAMRVRANELAEASNDAEDPDHVLAYRACAEELRRQADQLDANIILALTS